VEQMLEHLSIGIVEEAEKKDINCNAVVEEIGIENIDLDYKLKAEEHSLILILLQLQSHSY
jgi:hypothetical protein